MKQKTLTPQLKEQIRSLNQAQMPQREIAESLGLNYRQVTGVLFKARKSEKESQAKEANSIAYWQGRAISAEKTIRDKAQEEVGVNVLIDEIKSLAPVTYSPPPAPKFLGKPKSKGSPQSAVLMLSDTHIGQVIHPDQTMGLGQYSFDIFLRRLQRLEDSIFSITRDHTTTKVPEIVVAMIGDMIHGNLTHAVEAGQVNTLFNQFFSAGHAIAQFFRNISTIAPLRIYTAVGNHPRWGTQKKMPTDNRYSNLDQFLYAYVAGLLRDVPSIQFNLNKQPFALFDVQGYHFHAGHGDNVRGGDKALGIPNHAIGRSVSMTTQVFSSAGKDIPNYYLLGHLHRPITLPHCHGEVIINGGFPGVDGFALMENFSLAKPVQRFFLVHKRFGKAASYDLRLDLGDKTAHRYSLPNPDFTCK